VRGTVDYEATVVALDVGTSKVVALVGEVDRADGSVRIVGKGVAPTTGLKKGQVINIDQTVTSIRSAVAAAETTSGLRLEAAVVAVGGNHIESRNSRGMVAVSGQQREVGREDVERAKEVARSVSIPANRDLLHIIPRDFIVDGQEGVNDPIGMTALRLEVETLLVHGGATPIQNLSKCIRLADVRVDELVVSGLASAEAVLTETERELGVAVADIGAGTTDLALFIEGSPFHAAVLPLGGSHVTNDVAIGLKTTIGIAERLKVEAGSADPRLIDPTEQISLALADELEGRMPYRLELAEVIEARMREIFEKIGEEIERGGPNQRLPAGLVLTGGGALLAGAADLGREVLQLPVRVAAPGGIGGLTDGLIDPRFATSVGLLRWAVRYDGSAEPNRFETAPVGGMADRVRTWLGRLFP